jgi:hypothetical protein
MNLEESSYRLAATKADYLIIGYKNTGRKCIPPEYEMCIEYANKGNVYEVLKKLNNYRVFNVSESDYSKDIWDKHMAEYFQAKNEIEERALYEQLKKKFE